MKPEVSDAELQRFLQRQFRAQITMRPVAEGIESRTTAFVLAGEPSILRVGAAGSVGQGFLKDRLAYDRFRSATVAVPEVVAVGEFGPGLDYCITRRLPGATLEDSSPDAVTRVLDATVYVMAAIWATDVSFTSGYGVLDAAGRAPDASWQGHLSRIARECSEGVAEVVRDRAALRVLDAFTGLTNSCPEERRLFHRDFGAGNVLSDGARITGVLDWDSASCGDPLWDVATALFWATWLRCSALLEPHCRRRLGHLPGYAERTLCYALGIGLQVAARGHGEMRRWAGRRCLELLGQRG